MKNFAESLSDVLMRVEDLKVEAAAIIDAAKASGVNVKALRKVAKEMTMDASKLAERFDDERQIDLFRNEVGLLKRKGLALKEAA